MGFTSKIVLFGSNVSVGFVVVSLSLGNPAFPFGNRLKGYTDTLRKLLLCQTEPLSVMSNGIGNVLGHHGFHLILLYCSDR